ncbi:MAG: hypothetical protein IJB31_03055 [Akkermansia sp.]|nr:hypothetical protein [Akkermansia sp.]
MTPLLRCFFTLIGVLIAGVPLIYLTLPRDKNQQLLQQVTPAPQQEQPKCRTFLSLRYTGNLSSGILRYEDSVLAEIPAGTASPYELYIELPPNIKVVDIETELHWPEASPENVATLTLEPHGRPARTETQWTGSDGSLLHTIFSFTW